MKKRFSKICSLMAASAVMTVSVTAYAAVGDNIEAGFQPETETQHIIYAETEMETPSVEETETQASEEVQNNGLEAYIYIREKTKKVTSQYETESEEAAEVKKVTLEELKKSVEEEQIPELAAVVFQFAEKDEETIETETADAGIVEAQSEVPETKGYLETKAASETEADSEKGSSETEVEKKYPTVELTELQKEIVYETAECVPQTVILLNQCQMEDPLIFTDCEEVKAVTIIEAKDEESLEKQIQEYDIKKEYAAYLKLQEPEQQTVASNKTKTGLPQPSESNSELPSLQLQPTQQTETQKETTGTPSNRVAGSSSSTTSTTEKEVIFTFEPDDVYEGEEAVSATYSVESSKEVTYGKVTVSYDTSVMTYDDLNAEDSDALEGMTVKVVKPTDAGGSEGKIVIEFSSTTPKKLEGTFVDLWFNLKGVAAKGQQFNISMTVDELRNGSTNLTSEIKTASMIAQEDEEYDEESETETTASTQAAAPETTATVSTPETSAPQNAPKTGDTTNAALMILLMTGSAAVYWKARKRV